jgi:hypothetical protein
MRLRSRQVSCLRHRDKVSIVSGSEAARSLARSSIKGRSQGQSQGQSQSQSHGQGRRRRNGPIKLRAGASKINSSFWKISILRTWAQLRPTYRRRKHHFLQAPNQHRRPPRQGHRSSQRAKLGPLQSFPEQLSTNHSVYGGFAQCGGEHLESEVRTSGETSGIRKTSRRKRCIEGPGLSETVLGKEHPDTNWGA